MLYYRVKLLDTGFGIMESGSDLMSLEKEMRKTRFSVSYVSKNRSIYMYDSKNV